MRVLLTAHQFLPKYSGGTEVVTRDTALELLARGHDVHVLAVDPAARGKSIDVSHEDYEYHGLKVRMIGLPRRKSRLDIIREAYDHDLVAEHVRRYAKLVRPDVVHMFHLSRLSGSVIDVFRELGTPLVYTPTDFWAVCARSTLQKPSGELSTGPDELSSNCLECQGARELFPEDVLPETADARGFYRELARRALARAEGEHPNMALVRAMLARTAFLRERINSLDAILAPTKLMYRMLTANGIDPALIQISPYGLDASAFRGAGRPRSEGDGLRVGFMGTIHQQKGLHVLLEAFERLPRESGATLRVCGDLRSYPDYARKVYSMAGGDPRINFAGSFPNVRMPDELGKIDVLAVPSTWYENTPLVIYSAFAAGIPVVASNLGGMAEVVRDGENGLLFEPGDPDDLARRLRLLIDEPGLLERLGEGAGDVRSVEDSVDEILALYERLRAGKRQRLASDVAAPRTSEEG